MRMIKRVLLISLLSLIFVSCTKVEPTRYSLDDCVSWARPEGGLSLDSVGSLHFYKLPDFKGDNLRRIVGHKQQYVWLKVEFEVPQNLRYKSLGFVIPYLHFAEEAYFNGSYIGGYGRLPPNEYSAQYAAHFYTLPENHIKWNGTNIIYIKVLVKGKSCISDGIFIDEYNEAKNKAELLDFLHSRIYIVFEGILILATIFFLVISRCTKEDEKALRKLSLVNFFTMFFMCYFFASEVPWYRGLRIQGFILVKLFLCIPFYWIMYNIAVFVTLFIRIKMPKHVQNIGFVLTIINTLVTIAAPTYEFLRLICPLLILASCYNIFVAVFFFIKGFLTPENKSKTFFILYGFTPFLLTIVADFIIKNVFQKIGATYLALYGWFVTIVTFLIYSSYRYEKVFKQNERLTLFLKDEVAMKTVDLTFANERLERELKTAASDIDTAAIVQQKFYPGKQSDFDGWELAVCFEPMNKISGDLYDYYTDGKFLRGIGLFDVSGHGVSASLVAMLAKSIIFRSFIHGRSSGETVSTTLEAVNDSVIQEKGDVPNYLTGMLLRFAEFAEDDSCFVELSSAGHPYPIMYSAREDKIVTVTHDELQDQYGAIGIAMSDVSFPNVDLTLELGDVLIIFTDGLTEAVNENKEEFGKEKVEEILYENRTKTPLEIVEIIKEKLFNFMGDEPRSDDITFIVLKRVPRWV